MSKASYPLKLHDLGEDSAVAEVRAMLMARVTAGWSADEVRKGTEQRLASGEMMRKWALEVRPPASVQWIAPPEVNSFLAPSSD